MNRIFTFVFLGLSLTLASVKADAMSIPKVDGQIHNFTSYPTNSLTVAAIMYCVGLESSCGTTVESKAVVDANGNFHIRSKGEGNDWGWGTRYLSYVLYSNGTVISNQPRPQGNISTEFRDENSFKKYISAMSVYQILAGRLNLKLDNGADIDSWMTTVSPGRGFRARLTAAAKVGAATYQVPILDGLAMKNENWPFTWGEQIIPLPGNLSQNLPFTVAVNIGTSNYGTGAYQDTYSYAQTTVTGALTGALPPTLTTLTLNTTGLNLSIAGNWQGNVVFPGGPVESHLSLQCQNNQITGTLVTTDGQTSPVNGTCSPGNADFKFNIKMAPSSPAVTFRVTETSIWNGHLYAQLLDANSGANVGWVEMDR